jgi:hypothetical protein
MLGKHYLRFGKMEHMFENRAISRRNEVWCRGEILRIG